MKTDNGTPRPFTCGGSARLYNGKYPVFYNYNYGTNLTAGSEVVAVFEDKKMQEKFVRAVNSLDLNIKAFNDILSSNTLQEAKEYARKTLSNLQKN